MLKNKNLSTATRTSSIRAVLDDFKQTSTTRQTPQTLKHNTIQANQSTAIFQPVHQNRGEKNKTYRRQGTCHREQAGKNGFPPEKLHGALNLITPGGTPPLAHLPSPQRRSETTSRWSKVRMGRDQQREKIRFFLWNRFRFGNKATIFLWGGKGDGFEIIGGKLWYFQLRGASILGLGLQPNHNFPHYKYNIFLNIKNDFLLLFN